jgi:formylglycine-generating enzyme required for sulfatase activity
MNFILKGLFVSMIAVMSLCLLSDDAKPVAGNGWKIPGIDMEFIWIRALNCWVGKYEVTNGEYRKFKPEHDSRYYKGNSLNADRQPVVFVTFLDATAYAKWLTDRENSGGRIPDGYGYRLPTEKEWTTFCQCGDDREYPWGNEMPPKYGNYCGEETNGMTDKMISGYNDGFPVTCPVEKSGNNDWGLYGVGGNVWECTIKSSSDFYFDAWRGAAWYDFYPGALTSKSRLDYIAPYRAFNGGFRLVLTRLATE